MRVMASGEEVERGACREGDPDGAEAEEMISLCSIRAAGGLFGIDTRGIREVLGAVQLNRVPLAAEYFGGVIAYRGEVLTAVSLRVLLGGPPADGSCKVLVLDGDEAEERFGLLVDRVGGVVTVDKGSRSENPATLDDASRALFCGAFRTEEGLLVQLDPAKLLPSSLAASGLFGRAAGREGATR